MTVEKIISQNATVNQQINNSGIHLRSPEYYINRLTDWILHYGLRFLLAIIVLFIGFWLIKQFVKGLTRLMVSRQVDISLVPFLRSVTSIILKVFLVISVLSMLGFNTASFVTALGAAGLAIGLALQGSLSNFAGGVLILLFKPFKAGDFIEAQGHKGVVQEIQILYTILTTADNKKVVIPNGNLSNKDIINFSAEDTRRIDLKIPVSYKTDLQLAINILKKIANEDELMLKEPTYIIGVAELGNTFVTLDFFFWVNRPDYTIALHNMNEKIKAAFEAAGILNPPATAAVAAS